MELQIRSRNELDQSTGCNSIRLFHSWVYNQLNSTIKNIIYSFTNENFSPESFGRRRNQLRDFLDQRLPERISKIISNELLTQ